MILYTYTHKAGVMELVDVPDSKSGGVKPVRVRVSPPAQGKRRLTLLA